MKIRKGSEIAFQPFIFRGLALPWLRFRHPLATILVPKTGRSRKLNLPFLPSPEDIGELQLKIFDPETGLCRIAQGDKNTTLIQFLSDEDRLGSDSVE